MYNEKKSNNRDMNGQNISNMGDQQFKYNKKVDNIHSSQRIQQQSNNYLPSYKQRTMSTLFHPQPMLEPYYEQPFIKKPSLYSIGSPIVLHELLSKCIHQIYFQNKKLNEIDMFREIIAALQNRVRPNVSSSVMYQIIRNQVEQVCNDVRELVKQAYRKLVGKKQYNNDMKHHTDSWNVNFNKFRKATIQQNMNKVYGPIAHIICTYHNSLIDCNKQVYDLWKLLYHYSQIQDLEFKTLQGNLNEIVLQQLMREYPKNELVPRDVMPMISSYEKHEFIFKQMWGFQKRKGVVQFQGKGQQVKQTKGGKSNKDTISSKSLSLAVNSDQQEDFSQSMMSQQHEEQQQRSLKRLEKPQYQLSPPKPIPLSLQQQNKQNPFSSNSSSQQQLNTNDNTLQLQLNLLELQQQFANLDPETRMRIFQQLYQFKQSTYQSLKLDKSGLMSHFLTQQDPYLEHEGDIIYDNHHRLIDAYSGPIEIQLDDQDDDEECSQEGSEEDKDRNYFYEEKLHNLIRESNPSASTQIDSQRLPVEFQLDKIDSEMYKNQQNYVTGDGGIFMKDDNGEFHLQQADQFVVKETEDKYKEVMEQLKLINQTFNGKFQLNDHDDQGKIYHRSRLGLDFVDGERLPELLPIEKNKKLEDNLDQAKIKLAKMIQKQTAQQKQKFNSHDASYDKVQFNKNKQKVPTKTDRELDSLRDFKLEQQIDEVRKEPQNFYQTLKKYYQSKQGVTETKLSDKIQNDKAKKGKKTSQSQIYFAKNVNGSALAEFIADKKSFSQTLHSLTSNNKLSSKLQKISRQQIFDQIYEVAKQKQKRGHNLKMTYKKISYQLRGGEEKNEIKITEGSFTTDDLNWIEDLPEKTKYNLSESTDFGEKLIDEPNEDICQDDKPEKKKKKKKKKKNKQKKQASQNDNNFDKGSVSSFNQDEQDLEPLSEFRKKSIYDIFKLRKTLGWSQGQSIQQYLEANEVLQREKEEQLLMEKKIEIYEKTGQKTQQKSHQKLSAMSKEKKSKKQNYTEDELKLIQFLQTLEIKDQNRQKCVISEETLQRVIAKRKQIKSLEIFTKKMPNTQTLSNPTQKVPQNPPQFQRPNQYSSKSSKPKNKKKKK